MHPGTNISEIMSPLTYVKQYHYEAANLCCMAFFFSRCQFRAPNVAVPELLAVANQPAILMCCVLHLPDYPVALEEECISLV